MSGSVDEIEYILLALILIPHLYGVALDRDATLTLQIHIVQHLVLRAIGDRIGVVQQTVGKRTLTVIDVSNDAEVSYMFHVRV